MTPERYWEDDLQATIDIRWGMEEIDRLELIYRDRIDKLEMREYRLEMGRTMGVWAFFIQLLFWVLLIAFTP